MPLFSLGIALGGYGLLLRTQPASNLLLATSAAILSLATVTYGLQRPLFKVSLANAAAYVLAAAFYLLPRSAKPAWAQLVVSGVLLASVIAWLRLVVYGGVDRTDKSDSVVRKTRARS